MRDAGVIADIQITPTQKIDQVCNLCIPDLGEGGGNFKLPLCRTCNPQDTAAVIPERLGQTNKPLEGPILNRTTASRMNSDAVFCACTPNPLQAAIQRVLRWLEQGLCFEIGLRNTAEQIIEKGQMIAILWQSRCGKRLLGVDLWNVELLEVFWQG